MLHRESVNQTTLTAEDIGLSQADLDQQREAFLEVIRLQPETIVHCFVTFCDPDGALVPLPQRDPLPAPERIIPAFPASGLRVAAWRGW